MRLKDIEPAYQDPFAEAGRKLRAANETIERMEKVYYTHRYSPAYQDPDRRGRAQVTCGY
jgi:hypothetical protein